MKQKDRSKQLLGAALEVAARDGWLTMTRDAIARRAGVSPGLVSARLGSMIELRRAVMRAAIKSETLQVIAQGLVAKDRHALKAPRELQERALLSLAK